MMDKFSLTTLLNILRECPPTQRMWIAYSGGLDSHVLLHALSQLRHRLPNPPCGPTFDLRAIHIHHGLQPEADAWAKHCQSVCQELELGCEVVKVNAHAGARESPEARARQARYEAIAQLLSCHEVVVTAQHADDQAETVLLQMLRGSGVAGLAAMPKLGRFQEGWLMRPLLAYTRAQLYEYAQEQQLHWLEDPSNCDTRLDRNFLRHEIMPGLRRRWPTVSHTLSRVAKQLADANELIEVLAEQDWVACQGNSIDQLDLPKLTCLALARQRQVLKLWLKKLNLPAPASVHIQQILEEVLPARGDRQPLVTWPGGEVRRYRQHLFAMPNLPSPDPQPLSWSFPQPLKLPLGWLVAHELPSGGVVIPPQASLQVRFRQGGEICRWRGHQREVKKLFQEAAILPWLRPFIPLIYIENTLIAVPRIGNCEAWESGERGWEISWQV